MDTQTRRPSNISTPESHLEEIQEFFSCSYPDCDYKSNWEENVGTHEKTHNPAADSNIPCQVCSQKFEYLVSFLCHMSSQHSNKLFCPWCLFLGEDLDEFKTHTLAHVLAQSESTRRETGRRYYRCATCSKTYTRKGDFYGHQKHCNSDNPVTVENKEGQRIGLSCDKCSFTALYASRLRHHSQIHSSEKPFKCTNLGCTFMTRWPESLGQHKGCCRDRIQIPAVAGPVDKEKKKQTTGTLRRRLKTIEGEALPFKCTICSYGSNKKSNFMNHLIVHSDHKPFRCPRKGCNYRTRQAGNLRRHSNRYFHRKKAPIQSTENSGCRSGRESENRTDSTADSSSSFAFACMLCDFIGDSELSALKHACQHKTVVISLNRIS